VVIGWFGKPQRWPAIRDELIRLFDELKFGDERGSLTHLGMLIDRDEKDYVLSFSQPKHIKKLAESLDLPPVRSQKYPHTEDLFSIDADGDKCDADKYRSALMLANYIGRTRYDIRLPLAALSTRMQEPTNEDYQKLVQLARYLIATIDRKLNICASDLTVHCSADAAHAPHQDYKSHSGYAVWVGANNAPSVCISKKQTLVTKSSTAAELVALSDAVEQALWVRDMVLELGHKVGPVRVQQDNQSAMALVSREWMGTALSRAVGIRTAWVKEQIDHERVELVYVESLRVLADLLTKPVMGIRFADWVERILNDYQRR
jgi:hypothetical protein